MNKRGVTMLAVLFAIIYLMFGIITYQLLKPDIAIQRDASHLKCAAPDTPGDMAICLILDGIVPILIILIFATAGGIVTDQAIK